jgi:hypothetical protein
MDPLDQPPRQSLRKTTNSAQKTPAAPDIGLSEDEIRARAQSLRRVNAPSERGVVGAVGSAAVGTVEGVITRLLRLLRLPIAILAGLWVVFNVPGIGGWILGVLATFAIAFGLNALLRWLDLRAYRRKMG